MGRIGNSPYHRRLFSEQLSRTAFITKDKNVAAISQSREWNSRLLQLP